MQEKSPDGFRYSRCVVVRNTNPQLVDSTLVSWNYWFQDGTWGEWHASEKRFTLRFADVICEVLFRPLDTPADVVRVLGLEVTFAIIDEFREVLPKAIVEGLFWSVLAASKTPGDVEPTNWGMLGGIQSKELKTCGGMTTSMAGSTKRQGSGMAASPVRFPS